MMKRQPKHKNPHQRVRRRKRRGVLLLVVLSLLTLFLMLATAFLISAGQFRKQSKALQRLNEDASSSVHRADLLDEVVAQLLRDTSNQYSSLRFHSLLRDLYGNDGLNFELPSVAAGTGATQPIDTATATGVYVLTGGQMIELTMQFDGTTVALPNLSQLDDYYNGRVMTFVDGEARGQSVRIADYIVDVVDLVGPPPVFNCRFRLMRTRSDAPLPAAGDRVVINGAPFNGTGVGYNRLKATGARLTASESVSGTPLPIALMPNAAFLNADSAMVADTYAESYFGADWSSLSAQQKALRYNLLGLAGQGGSDESYDAVDFQNMFLARMPVNPATQSTVAGVLVDAAGRELVIPSFHRPALLNYWDNQLSGALSTNPMMLRKVMLRPNPLDHPSFTGSNPAGTFYPVTGPWDVDNDGDGVPDSVWVDFGAPVIEGPNGKRVKPLAAILCLDLDGRLNVNAHGSLDLAGVYGAPTSQTLAGDVPSAQLPHGLGFGPADISLASLLGGQFNNVLRGSDNISGRYGWDKVYNNSPSAAGTPLSKNERGPGVTVPTSNSYYLKRSFDLAAQLKMTQAPIELDGRILSGFATPPDFSARYGLGVNDLGQPVYEAMSDSNPRLLVDSPYELDLSLEAPRGEGNGPDAPYSLAELERILRAFDADAGALPDRLWNTSNAGSNLAALRALLTSDSYDLPTPSVVPPSHIVFGSDKQTGGIDEDADFADVMPGGRQPVNLTFADMLEYRLRIGLAEKLSIAATAVPAERIRQEMALMLAPELASGQRLDINRPVGNGFDDNGNGVVDEPYEAIVTGTGAVTGDVPYDGSPWARSDSDLPAGFVGMEPPRLPVTYRESVYWPLPVPAKVDTNNNQVIGEDLDGDMIIDEISLDANGDGSVSPLDSEPAQLMARHLYVLAMTLVDPLPSTATDQDKKNRARRLAQWAVNCVDFRDSNSVMTAFEFDYNPFDGWDVDGRFDGVQPDMTPNSDPMYASADDSADYRGVVFGCERPELVMTETMAWHDRNTEDTSRENPNPGEEAKTMLAANDPDADFDQLRRPEGAFFLELYNPWPATTGTNADTHAVKGFTGGGRGGTGEDLGVNLAATVVDSSGSAVAPVWRLAVYKTPPNLSGDDVGAQTFTWDPDSPDTDARPTTNMDRSVYFTNDISASALEAIDANDGVEFFTSLNVEPVRPGRFMVVGSGKKESGQYVAHVGRRKNSPTGGRAVVLDPTNAAQPIKFREPDGDDVIPALESSLSTELQQSPGRSICDVAVINQAVESGTAVERRLTVTEPADGYPDRTDDGVRWDPDGNSGEGWYGVGGQQKPVDTPLDDIRPDGTNQRRDGETRLALTSMEPGDQAQGTIPCFSWIYLQRLANPTLPFHKDANPYLTVDAMSVNVTVFNGRWALTGGNGGEEIRVGYDEEQGGERADLPDPEEYLNTFPENYFQSLQRGFAERQEDPSKTPTLWAMELPNGPVGNQGGKLRNFKFNGVSMQPIRRKKTENGNKSHLFNAIADCTLGFLGRPFLDPTNATTPDNNPNARIYGGNPPSIPADLQLKPQQPYPWLTWNNRPYASAEELMQVPAVRSSQLFRTFSNRSVLGNNDEDEAYDQNSKVRNSPDVRSTRSYNLEEDAIVQADGPFGHTANFFRVEDDGSNDTIPGMYRVLDYIAPTSLFVGTETWLNPAAFNSGIPSNLTGLDDPRLMLQPPHNRVSAYRDPGRVNLNTITSADVWDGGLLQREKQNNGPWDPSSNNYRNNTGHRGPLYWNNDGSASDLISRRRGYGNANTSPLTLETSSPTFFANPFRSADAADLVPLPQMVRTPLDATLLRSEQGTAGVTPESKGDPLLATKTTNTGEYNNSDRNSYFRYQPMARLASLTTDRSNVFAVWVTIGFFEVEEAQSLTDFETANGLNPGDAANLALYQQVYPEGYALAREEGIETGEQRRLRGFYVIDRTVPVGFEPGEDFNVGNAVRLKRKIE